MDSLLWFYVLVLLLAMWNGIARELRNALIGYLVQTLLIAALYVNQAVHFDDSQMWVALAGLITIRVLFIPWMLLKKLPYATAHGRHNGYVVTPAYMVIIFTGIALLSLGVTEAAGGPLSAPFGAALATLVIGLVSVALSHDAGKQVMGLLTADNGTDLAIVTVLQRVSVFGDYVVFVDIALAVVLLVVLVLKFRQAGSLTMSDYHELKG